MLDSALATLVIYGLSKVVPWLRCLCKDDHIALILPSHCGKSNLLNSLDINYKTKYLFIDINSDIWSRLTQQQKDTIKEFQSSSQFNNLQLFILPIYQDYIDELKRKFPKKRLCLLFSDISLPKLLGIKFYKYFIPSQRFLTQICDTLTVDQSVETKDSVNKIVQLKGNKVDVVGSFDQLLEKVQKQFNIKLKY